MSTRQHSITHAPAPRPLAAIKSALGSLPPNVLERVRRESPAAATLLTDLGRLVAQVERLHAALAHGSAAHRSWLDAALTAHFAGLPVPPHCTRCLGFPTAGEVCRIRHVAGERCRFCLNSGVVRHVGTCNACDRELGA